MKLTKEQIDFLHKIQSLREADKLNTGYNEFIVKLLKCGQYTETQRASCNRIVKDYIIYKKTGKSRYSTDY